VRLLLNDLAARASAEREILHGDLDNLPTSTPFASQSELESPPVTLSLSACVFLRRYPWPAQVGHAETACTSSLPASIQVDRPEFRLASPRFEPAASSLGHPGFWLAGALTLATGWPPRSR